MGCGTCRPPHHPFFQPKDWLALSSTCKSCNRMVSEQLLNKSILLNFELQVTEFIKQNKRLVFLPDSGCARVFKLLTRFFREESINLIHPDSRHSVNLRVAGFPFCTWLTDKLLQPVSFAFFFLNASISVSFVIRLLSKTYFWSGWTSRAAAPSRTPCC